MPVERPRALVRALVLFLVIAAPLVLLVWHELSELLIGRVHPIEQLEAVVLLAVLVYVVARFGRYLSRLAEDAGHPHEPRA